MRTPPDTSATAPVQSVATPVDPDDDDFTLTQVSKRALTVGTIGLFLLFYLVFDLLVAGTTALASGGVLSFAIALLNRDHPVPRSIGSVLLFPATAGILAAIALTGSPETFVVLMSYLMVVSGAFAAFGVVGTWTASIGYKRVKRALARASYSLLPPIVVTAALLVPHVATIAQAISNIDQVVIGSLSAIVWPGQLQPHLGSFCLLLGATAYISRTGLKSLPILAFTPQNYIQNVDDAMELLTPWLRRSYFVTFPVGFFVGLLEAIGAKIHVYESLPRSLLTLLTALTTTPGLRYLLLGLIVAIVGLMVVTGAIEWVASMDRLKTMNIAAHAAGGILATVLIYLAGIAFLQELLVSNPAFQEILMFFQSNFGTGVFALIAVSIAIILFLLLVGVLPVMGSFGVLPDRGAAQSTIALSLAWLGIGAELGHHHTLLFFVGIVGALVVWDIGEYSTQIAEELGPAATVGHVELVHVLSSVLVGVFTIAGGLTLLRLTGTGTLSIEVVMPALVGGVIGAVILLAILASSD